MLLATILVVTLVAVALRRSRWAAVALRVSRWTWGAFVLLGLLYFPMQTGFRLSPLKCEWKFDLALAAFSLQNYQHIILLMLFFLITYAQLPDVPGALVWSLGACLAMGFLVELAQGVTGFHHCRMRDLIPDSAGALAGALIVLAGRRMVALRRATARRRAQ